VLLDSLGSTRERELAVQDYSTLAHLLMCQTVTGGTCSPRISDRDELMQIRVYIDPNGDVTITTLLADLVPLAYALDNTDWQVQYWLDALSEATDCRPEMGEVARGRISTRQLVES
jgi:hypothetical protein